MRVAVLTGGSSTERDVALASGAQAVTALRSRGHEVTVVDTVYGVVPRDQEEAQLSGTVERAPREHAGLVARERQILLSGLGSMPAIQNADVAFLALHGGQGEDGTVQAVLDVLGVPYTGSGALGSAVAMDKDISKRLFQLAGVATAPWLMAPPPMTAQQIDDRLGWPVVIKPSKQGSTVGLSVVSGPLDLAAAFALAAQYDDETVVETFVPGRELTVGILEDKALAVGEIIPNHDIFDYECKYTPGMSQEIFPADLPPDVAANCQRLGVLVHRALKLGGYSRVDFRLTPKGELLCLEVNTLPGLTATSLLPQSAAAVGIPFAELCERICLVPVGRER